MRSPRHSPRPRRRVALFGTPLAAVAAALAAVAALVVLPAAPAQAGGPTSVLVVNPEAAAAAAAYTGSDAYERLASALDVYGTPTGEARPQGAFMSAQVRLTWLVHDVQPWRVDGVVLDGTDVWVTTAVDHSGGSPFEAASVWHRPKDAPLLLATLRSMGVLDRGPGATATGGTGGTGHAAANASGAVVAPPAQPESADPAAAPLDANSIVPGLAGAFAGGLLLGALGVRALVLGRRRAGQSAAGAPAQLAPVAGQVPRSTREPHLRDDLPPVGFRDDGLRTARGT